MAACERCPSPGACASCPFLRPQIIEFGNNVRVVTGGTGIKELLKEKRLPEVIYLRPDFSSARFGGGETPTPIKKSEENCSECNEPASTCRHSEFKTSALKAA